jgi:hypothetical protein
MQILDIQIRPSYGKSQAIVSWTPDTELTGADPDYYVFRSPDGAGDWAQVNDDPIEGVTEHLDMAFHFASRSKIPHYRVMAKLSDGTAVHSHTKGLFATMTRGEFTACHYIINQEYMQSRISGYPVLHFIPLTRGVVAPNWNETTGRVEGPCEDAGMESYGQKYVGGYRPPYTTYLRELDSGPIVKIDRDDGLGILDEFKMPVRMLAFPRPEKGHLIVNPATDDRYTVTEVVKPFKMRGIYPVAYQAQLELLRREDPAYLLPIPEDF